MIGTISKLTFGKSLIFSSFPDGLDFLQWTTELLSYYVYNITESVYVYLQMVYNIVLIVCYISYHDIWFTIDAVFFFDHFCPQGEMCPAQELLMDPSHSRCHRSLWFCSTTKTSMFCLLYGQTKRKPFGFSCLSLISIVSEKHWINLEIILAHVFFNRFT